MIVAAQHKINIPVKKFSLFNGEISAMLSGWFLHMDGQKSLSPGATLTGAIIRAALFYPGIVLA
jgi:hypothetical protein